MTSKQRIGIFVATHKRLTAVALAIAAFTGCSMMNPYDHTKLAEDPSKPADAASPPGLRLAGFASEGQAADDIRQTYYNNLRYTSYVRNGTAAT